LCGTPNVSYDTDELKVTLRQKASSTSYDATFHFLCFKGIKVRGNCDDPFGRKSSPEKQHAVKWLMLLNGWHKYCPDDVGRLFEIVENWTFRLGRVPANHVATFSTSMVWRLL
jgi:hypothetical protein